MHQLAQKEYRYLIKKNKILFKNSKYLWFVQEFLNLPENTSKHFTYDSVSDTDVTVKAENLSATHKTNTSQVCIS